MSSTPSPAKTYLKMRLIMKKSSGIARYVHHPYKNSVEYVFWSAWLAFASDLKHINQNSTCYRSSQLKISEKLINLKKSKRNRWKMVLKTCSLKVCSCSLQERVIDFKDYFWLNLQLYYEWAPSVRYSIQKRRKTKNSGGVKTLIFIIGKVFKKSFEFLHSFIYFFKKRVGKGELVLSQNFSKVFRISFV